MQVRHGLIALLIMFVWGFNFVVIRVGLNEIPPLLLGSLRFFFTSIPIIFFLKKPPIAIKKIFAYAFFMFVCQFSFFFVGMSQGVAPGLASLLMQSQVFFSLFFASLFFKEKPHIWQFIGGITAFLGIALVASHTGLDVSTKGLLLILVGAASWGLGNIVSKKISHVPESSNHFFNTISLVVWGGLIACPIFFLLSFFLEGGDVIVSSLKNMSYKSLLAVLYIAYLATIFGYGCWSWLLHHHKISFIAPFALLVPVIGMVSSVIILGEPLHIWKIQAALLVIGGLCINLFGPKLVPKKALPKKQEIL